MFSVAFASVMPKLAKSVSEALVTFPNKFILFSVYCPEQIAQSRLGCSKSGIYPIHPLAIIGRIICFDIWILRSTKAFLMAPNDSKHLHLIRIMPRLALNLCWIDIGKLILGSSEVLTNCPGMPIDHFKGHFWRQMLSSPFFLSTFIH